MLAREHELLQAWRAQGWTDVGPLPGNVGGPEGLDQFTLIA